MCFIVDIIVIMFHLEPTANSSNYKIRKFRTYFVEENAVIKIPIKLMDTKLRNLNLFLTIDSEFIKAVVKQPEIYFFKGKCFYYQ